MKAYSLDVRERIVRAVDQGYARAEIIELFGVSRATIKRYLKQRCETGQLRRKPIPGRPPKKSAPLQTGLVAQLEAHPDATLEMLLPHLGTDFWRARQHEHDEPGYQARRLDPQKEDTGCDGTRRRRPNGLARAVPAPGCGAVGGHR